MRIALLIYGDLALTSGGFLYDRKVVEALRELGDEVDVVSLPWPSYLGGLLSNRLRIAWPRPPCDYDVIVEDELIHPAMVWRNQVLRRRGARLIGLVHNLTCEQPSTRHKSAKDAIETAYLQSLHGVVAVCRSTLESSISRARRGLPHAVAYPGCDHVTLIDEGVIASRAHEQGPLRVLSLAQVAPHKGQHRLVRALREVPDGVAVELVLVGSLSADPAYVANLGHEVSRLGAHVTVIVRGELHGPDLTRELERAHVMALASDREAYPISCLEGLAHGLVVLVTDQGGTSELICHERDGCVLHPEHTSAWARAFVALARDRERLSAMAKNARERARAHGTWRETALVLRSVCEQVSSAND